MTDAEELLIRSVGESNVPWARGEQNDLRPSEKGTVTVPPLDGHHKLPVNRQVIGTCTAMRELKSSRQRPPEPGVGGLRPEQ